MSQFTQRTLRITFYALLLLFVACRQEMHDQPRYEALEASSFFKDGRSARPQVPGTVARGQLRTDTHLYIGKSGENPVETFPFEMTREDLARGGERYNIFCSPCHDRIGNGEGIIVRRGFRRPSSFHIERLREAPVGYFYDVITNGFGTMYSYADRIPPQDRWRIVAYIRALQFSQHAILAELPPEEQRQLKELEPE
jgi:hypothetical protein